MSHFCGIVFIEATSANDAESQLSSILSPYDEELTVDPYIYRTKKELIESIKKEVEGCKQFIQENSTSENIFTVERLISYQNKLMKWNNFETEEDCINYAQTMYVLDEDGNELSTYNPNSKWDWYVVGGRWDGDILHAGDYDTNNAPKEALTKVGTPYCFVDLDGNWHEKGSMGWWGISYDEKDNWESEFRSYLDSVPDNTYLVLVDFHI